MAFIVRKLYRRILSQIIRFVGVPYLRYRIKPTLNLFYQNYAYISISKKNYLIKFFCQNSLSETTFKRTWLASIRFQEFFSRTVHTNIIRGRINQTKPFTSWTVMSSRSTYINHANSFDNWLWIARYPVWIRFGLNLMLLTNATTKYKERKKHFEIVWFSTYIELATSRNQKRYIYDTKVNKRIWPILGFWLQTLLW